MFEILGIVLLNGIIGGAIGAAVTGAAIAIIDGILDRQRLKELMREKNVDQGVITMIDRCSNQVTLKDLERDVEQTYQADEIGYDISEYDTIYA